MLISFRYLQPRKRNYYVIHVRHRNVKTERKFLHVPSHWCQIGKALSCFSYVVAVVDFSMLCGFVATMYHWLALVVCKTVDPFCKATCLQVFSSALTNLNDIAGQWKNQSESSMMDSKEKVQTNRDENVSKCLDSTLIALSLRVLSPFEKIVDRILFGDCLYDFVPFGLLLYSYSSNQPIIRTLFSWFKYVFKNWN